MSHSPERKEKICLNCNAQLHGRFCHICGQENLDPKESFVGLITHFFNDITHFDGKFFSTVKYLVFKPGYLSLEYSRGRRASYLHPIRMYIFTSAVFFIIFFSLFNFEDPAGRGGKALLPDSSVSAIKAQSELEMRNELEALKRGDSLQNAEVQPPSLTARETSFPTRAFYDSSQKALPAGERDGWLKRTTTYKAIEINEKFREDPNGMVRMWLSKFMHMLPQLLFVSLPVFALILKLLYRRKKQFYYADHAIFSIHLYIFAFVAMMVYFMLLKLYDTVRWGIFNYLLFFLGLYMAFYTYKALRKFYQDSRLKTFVKYCLLSLMSFIVLIILFSGFFMLSIFKI